jgi:hypothetical protein
MRKVLILSACAFLFAGCTHISLERNTLKQVSTVTDLRYREVLTNVAAMCKDPSYLPAFAMITGGGTQIGDSLSSNPGGTLNIPTTSGSVSIGVTAGRNVQENWTTDPIKDPDALEAMRCALQVACGQCSEVSESCAELLATYKVDKKLEKVQPQWFHVGCKRDVPRAACYVGQYCDTYVWVTAEGVDSLATVALILLDIATYQATSPHTMTVETLKYDQQGHLVEVVKRTVPDKSQEQPGTIRLKPRKDYHDPLLNQILLNRGR